MKIWNFRWLPSYRSLNKSWGSTSWVSCSFLVMPFDLGWLSVRGSSVRGVSDTFVSDQISRSKVVAKLSCARWILVDLGNLVRGSLSIVTVVVRLILIFFAGNVGLHRSMNGNVWAIGSMEVYQGQSRTVGILQQGGSYGKRQKVESESERRFFLRLVSGCQMAILLAE